VTVIGTMMIAASWGAIRLLSTGRAAPIRPDTMRSALMLLGIVVLLFVIFVLGLLLARAMRRGRAQLTRKPAEPTEYVDAWSMHKLPQDQPPVDPDRPDERNET
jgi:hypothetical protein